MELGRISLAEFCHNLGLLLDINKKDGIQLTSIQDEYEFWFNQKIILSSLDPSAKNWCDLFKTDTLASKFVIFIKNKVKWVRSSPGSSGECKKFFKFANYKQMENWRACMEKKRVDGETQTASGDDILKLTAMKETLSRETQTELNTFLESSRAVDGLTTATSEFIPTPTPAIRVKKSNPEPAEYDASLLAKIKVERETPEREPTTENHVTEVLGPGTPIVLLKYPKFDNSDVKIGKQSDTGTSVRTSGIYEWIDYNHGISSHPENGAPTDEMMKLRKRKYEEIKYSQSLGTTEEMTSTPTKKTTEKHLTEIPVTPPAGGKRSHTKTAHTSTPHTVSHYENFTGDPALAEPKRQKVNAQSLPQGLDDKESPIKRVSQRFIDVFEKERNLKECRQKQFSRNEWIGFPLNGGKLKIYFVDRTGSHFEWSQGCWIPAFWDSAQAPNAFRLTGLPPRTLVYAELVGVQSNLEGLSPSMELQIIDVGAWDGDTKISEINFENRHMHCKRYLWKVQRAFGVDKLFITMKPYQVLEKISTWQQLKDAYEDKSGYYLRRHSTHLPFSGLGILHQPRVREKGEKMRRSRYTVCGRYTLRFQLDQRGATDSMRTPTTPGKHILRELSKTFPWVKQMGPSQRADKSQLDFHKFPAPPRNE